MAAVSTRQVAVSRRADGQPWQIRIVKVSGSSPGPVTAFVAGIFGDKPLATKALWALVRRLEAEQDLRGSVILIPAANPFALETGTRVSPDHLYLNRVFPGAAQGFVTQQIARVLLTELLNETDTVVDLHSGTPTMSLWYSYDYGDVDFSASFGYTPVVTNFAQAGQLSKAVVDAGGKSVLVEFGGGMLGDHLIAVEGCLNVLRYRNQIGGQVTGPGRIPLIEGDVSLYLPSATGILTSLYSTDLVGQPVPKGPVAQLHCAATGEQLEEFSAEREGALLMLARVSPTMITAGEFGAVVAYPSREIDVPGR
jgi:predicted deacylase